MIETLFCPWESPFLMLFSSNVPQLLYYSHLPVLLLALIVGGLVYFKGKTLTSGLLATVLGLFSFYALIDILIWATNRSDIVLFLWSIQVMIEVLIFAASCYLVYVVINKQDASMKLKLIYGAILLPFIALIPTQYNLIGIDLAYCDAIEGFVALYVSYALEIFFSLVLVSYAVYKYSSTTDKPKRREIVVLTTGVMLFLTALISGNLIGSFTGNWDLAQFGFFGMPVFIILLAYLIVQFKTFDLKIIGAQVFVVGLWALIGSLFFVRNIDQIRLINLITLILSIGFGVLLIRSVKRQITLREELEVANEGQANLLHIINHQIKGYMTKARLTFDDLLTDPSYNISASAVPMLKQGFDSVTEGVDFVQDFLNASNIERGTFDYNMVPMNFSEIVSKHAKDQEDVAKEKKLSFEVKIEEGEYNVTGDIIQLGQAVRNLIDNSIKYTPTGGLKIRLERKGEKILFSVSDTGVGLSDEVKPKLFTKGGRDKDSQKINVNSTGFGLAFVKGVAEAHKGRVWATSPGVGKGSNFYMELPAS